MTPTQTSHSIKPTDTILMGNLDPGMYVNATEQKPSAQTPLSTSQ